MRGPPPASTLFPYTTLFRSKVWRDQSEKTVEMKVSEAPDEREARERSEEHTSELQSHSDLVCRLLLEKKNTNRDRLRSPRSPSPVAAWFPRGPRAASTRPCSWPRRRRCAACCDPLSS